MKVYGVQVTLHIPAESAEVAQTLVNGAMQECDSLTIDHEGYESRNVLYPIYATVHEDEPTVLYDTTDIPQGGMSRVAWKHIGPDLVIRVLDSGRAGAHPEEQWVDDGWQLMWTPFRGIEEDKIEAFVRKHWRDAMVADLQALTTDLS